MTAWALRALLLLALDVRSGEWCTVDWLIARLAKPRHVVQQQAVDLVAAGQIMTHTLLSGEVVYGVQVESSTAPVNDWRNARGTRLAPAPAPRDLQALQTDSPLMAVALDARWLHTQ